MAWFDKHENQPGILTARLAADAPSLEKISGTQLGVMVEATCLVIVSLSIACKYSWQLTLVNLAFFPFLVLASVLQVIFLKLPQNLAKNELKSSKIRQNRKAT